jgi:transposase-like protein
MTDDGVKRYPVPKERDLTAEEKDQLRERIERGESNIYQLAQEFGCSPSQVAGIKAAMHR